MDLAVFARTWKAKNKNFYTRPGPPGAEKLTDMKYTSCIDNVRAVEWGLNLQEAYAFSFCYSLPSWAETLIIGGEVWYFGSRNKAMEEIPLLTDKPDTVYRHYKALSNKGIIEWKKVDGKDCIRITAKGKQWNTSEINPPLGNKSEYTRKNIRKSSEINPTNKITINKGTIDKSDAPAEVSEMFAPDQHEKTADDIISYLKENPQYLGAMAEGDWERAVKQSCLKLQSNGEFFQLRIPPYPGEYYKWISRRIASAQKWYATAADIDKKQNRNNGTATNKQRKTVTDWTRDDIIEQGRSLGITVY